MKEKNIIFGARMMSMLFTPFYLPIVGLIALFTFSYMSQLPWDYKLEVLLLVYIATIFIPTILIHLYRRYQGWTLIELGHKERRMVPYVISILCYFGCYYLMSVLQIPHGPHIGCRPRCASGLRAYQRLVEDFHALGSHRWRGRRFDGLCFSLHVQPRMVALLGVYRGRTGWNQSHDTSPTLALAGGSGVPRRYGLRVCGDITNPTTGHNQPHNWP